MNTRIANVAGLWSILALCLVVCGCWNVGGQAGVPDGGDIDTDSDTDIDTDSDADTDADADTDTGTDTEFTCEGVLHFPDPNFELSVCLSLGIFDNATDTCTADILAEDVAEMTYFSSLASSEEGMVPEHYITDLTGLECMTNLTTLVISKNYSPFDLSPLAGAGSLEVLYASWNQIDDLSPLTGLTQLNWLELQHNEISDVSPLSGMNQLIGLGLSNNLISDVSSLFGLSQLTVLILANNEIDDVSPLSSLINLDSLSLSYNEVSDIDPLASLTVLYSLGITSNDVSDIDAVASMTGLASLSFQMNNVTDLTPLVNNASFADGCSAHFNDNPIDCDDQAANIATLKNRGVGLVCDCDECGL